MKFTGDTMAFTKSSLTARWARWVIILVLVSITALIAERVALAEDDILYPVSRFDPKLRRYAVGYIDSLGLESIEAKFRSGDEFYEGLAMVQAFGPSDKLFGFIDLTGKLVIPAKYYRVKPFSEGLAVVAVKTKDKKRLWGVIDKTGKTIFANQEHEIRSFSDGLALVRSAGYINTSGKLVLKLGDIKADKTGDFSQALAAVRVDGKYGYINRTGKIVIEAKFERAGKFSQGLAAVRVAGKYGFINTKGELVIDAKYDRAGRFSEGLSAVRSGKLYGFVDKTGKEVISCQFLRALAFSEGLAPCQILTEKWVFINPSGETIIKGDSQWVYAEPFRNAVAKIGSNRWVNKKGRVIWKPNQ